MKRPLRAVRAASAQLEGAEELTRAASAQGFRTAG